MKGTLSRRGLLVGAGHAAAFGALAAALPRHVSAQDAEESAILFSMLYPNKPDGKFDSDYYSNKLVPLVRSLYGSAVERIELCEPHMANMPKAPKNFAAGQSHSPSDPPARRGPPPPVVRAATRIWIADAKAFSAAATANGGKLATALNAMTDITPTVQYERDVDVRGDARNAIEVGAQVSSTWFPTEDGKTFDAKYYGEKIIPLMVQLYGAKAIRRVEFSLGSAPAGTQPPLTAAVHYNIRDRMAWNMAGMQAGMKLMAEGPKYTTMKPVMGDMVVSAVG